MQIKSKKLNFTSKNIGIDLTGLLTWRDIISIICIYWWYITYRKIGYYVYNWVKIGK